MAGAKHVGRTVEQYGFAPCRRHLRCPRTPRPPDILVRHLLLPCQEDAFGPRIEHASELQPAQGGFQIGANDLRGCCHSALLRKRDGRRSGEGVLTGGAQEASERDESRCGQATSHFGDRQESFD